MPELPPELWQAIIDKVDDQANLLQLLLVSLKFNSIAERRLYHTISLSAAYPLPDVADRKWSVFERISTCPRVAAHVVSLAINTLSWTLSSADTSSLLAKAFLSIPNLKILHIYVSDSLKPHFPTRVPFLLRTFTCTGPQRDDPFTHTLEIFLEAQVELKEFESDYNLSLAPSALPKLTTFLGPCKFLHAILPGRPVTRATLLYDGTAFYAYPVFQAAAHLRSFRVAINDLPLCTALFPTLTFLEYIAYGYVTEDIIPFLHHLSSLKKLKIKILADRHADLAQYLEWVPLPRLTLINSAFAASQSLSYVETYDLLPDNNNSLMWTRNSQTGIASLCDQDEWKKW